jgi:hypothetical protein
MVARAFWTGAALLFAIGAFCGLGPEKAGLLNPMGFLCLAIAVVVWRGWGAITGNFSPALFDGMVQGGPRSAGDAPVVPEIYLDKLSRRDPPR